MEQYIKKATVVAEIERLKECNRKICAGDFDFLKENYPEYYYSTEIYNDILSFLNTLEVKDEVVSTDPTSPSSLNISRSGNSRIEAMKEALRLEYEKGRADTIAEMYVPTQISPEESLGVSSEKYMDIVDTLMQGGQKPAKWSLEDERVIAIINNALTESNTPPDDYDKVYDWLESLRKRIGG